MHACPGCGREIRDAMFLCNLCAHAVPDELVIEMARAVSEADQQAFDAAVLKVRELLAAG